MDPKEERTKLRTYMMLFVLTIAAALLMPQAVQAAYIPTGFDYFMTDYGSVAIPGVGTVQLQGFQWPGTLDPTQLFPLPPGALPPTTAGFQVTWLDPHGTVVGPESQHKVTQVLEPVYGAFDTVIRRKAGADISGVGDSAIIPIEIVWLSLKSSAPIDIGLPSLVDVYVGLNPGGQIEGKTELVSTTSLGNAGTIGIGIQGVTPFDPADPDFLGLPVTYDVLFIPHDMDPIQGNVVSGIYGVPTVFQGGPSLGKYKVVPEPSALILALSVSGLVFRRRLFRRRDG